MLRRFVYLEQNTPPAEASDGTETDATGQLCRMSDVGHPAPPRPTILPSALDAKHCTLAEIEREAALTQLETAPSIYPSDMPSYLPQALRETLYVRLLSLAVNLENASRQAIAHEMTPPDLYWDKAVRDCIPIIESAIMSKDTGKSCICDEGIEALGSAFNYIEDQLSPSPPMLGKSEACTSLMAALLTEGVDYSTNDLEIILGHFLAHARIGNRRAEQN